MSDRVVIVTDTPLPDDGLEAVRALHRVGLLARRGGGVLLAPAGPGGPVLLPGIRHVPLDVPPGLDAARREGEVAERIGPELDRLRPGVVHCFGVGAAVPAVLRRRAGTRVVIEPGVTPAQRLRAEKPDAPAARLEDLVALEDKTLGRADAVIARSAVEAATLVKRGVPTERVWTIRDGLPTEPRDEAPPDLPHVVYLGDLSPWSGWQLPLDALARVKRPWRLTMVLTPDSTRGIIERRARAAGLDGRVDFARLDEEDAPRRVLAAQVVVCPLTAARPVVAGSVVPEAVLWAVACGRPLIAPDLAVVRAYAGAAAVWFDPEDTGALARRLDEVLADPGLRADLATHAVEQRKRLHWEAADAQVGDLWSTLLAEPE